MRSSWLYGLLAILPIPFLLFSSTFPVWTPLLALAWLAALFILHGISTRRWLSNTPADLILLGMLAILPLGLWASADRDVTLARTFALIANIALFYAIAIQSENASSHWAGWLILLGGLAFIVLIVPGIHFYPSQKLPFIGRSIYKFIPSIQYFSEDKNGFNPNMAGGLLALFLPPALALSIRNQNLRQRILAVFVAFILVIVVLLTQSRGAILASIIASAIVTGILSKPLRWLWSVLGLLSAGFLVVRSDFVVQALYESENTTGVHSLSQRMELWNRAIYAGADFPFTGIGLGQFPDTIQKLYPPSNIVLSEEVPHAHNFFLHTLATLGYPGVVLYVAFFLILLAVLIRRIRQASDWRRPLAIGLLGSLAVFLVHGLVDVPTYSPISAIVIWGLFGAMMAVGLAGDRSPQPQEVKHD